jgi:hypothetical protein
MSQAGRLRAIRTARTAARERALAGDAAPGDSGGSVTIDLDATTVSRVTLWAFVGSQPTRPTARR